MNFTEKIDVLDLIIETLKEHEKVLDEIVTRLDALVKGESRGSSEARPINGSSLKIGADRFEGPNLGNSPIGGSPNNIRQERVFPSSRMRDIRDPRLLQENLWYPGIRQVPPLRQEHGGTEIPHGMDPAPSYARGGQEHRGPEASPLNRNEVKSELHLPKGPSLIRLTSSARLD